MQREEEGTRKGERSHPLIYTLRGIHGGSKLAEAVKPNSFTAESATTFTSYSIDAALAEAE